MDRYRVWLSLVVAPLVVAALLTAAPPAVDPTAASASALASATLAVDPPNIVLISTDDQTTYDLRWMPYTRSLIAGHGVDFTDALSPHSLCCPARAEIVTGQYGQNNGVHHNDGPHGGYQALRHPDNNVGRWLQHAGYRTAVVGKFLNGFSASFPRPEGWDHFNPWTGNTTYTESLFYHDGDPVLRDGYVDDITNQYARDYIEEFSGAQPFFVWVSNYAPHRVQGRPDWNEEYAYPADRFRDTLTDVPLPALTKRSFNEQDVADQPTRTHVHPVDPADMQQRFTYRIESLQAADEGVRDLVETLRSTGELDSTYIDFVSDNGYLLGEHRLTHKNYIFRESMAIPFAVRTPEATGRSVSTVPVTLTDLAPTFSALAGAAPERVVDGVSFLPLLEGGTMHWRDTQLIQTGKTGASHRGWQIRGVRTQRYTYGLDLVSREEQLYDRLRTPSEVRNLVTSPRYRDVLLELRHRMRALRGCSGAACRADLGPVPAPG